jgi:serine/threonine-protein kinase SMG1
MKSISCIGDSSYQRLKSVLSPENTDRIIESLNRLLHFISIDSVFNSNYNDLIFGPANYCIELFYDIFDDKIFSLNDLIIDYLTKQNRITQSNWSHDVDLSFVRLLSKLITFYIQTNNIELFRELFSIDGRLWMHNKQSQNSKLIQETLTLYKSLIIVKSIPIVQEIYKTILNDAESSLNLIISNLDDSNSSRIKMAETSFLFDLCIFAELGNAKNNLICMYALTPTLFELLTVKLSPCNWSLADYYPNIQFAILNTLYSHCLRHEHFIISSTLFSTKSSPSLSSNVAGTGSDSSAILTNAPTRDQFKIIIEILTKLISHTTSSFNLVSLILNWLVEIIEFISVENAYIFDSLLFTNLYNGIICAGMLFIIICLNYYDNFSVYLCSLFK